MKELLMPLFHAAWEHSRMTLAPCSERLDLCSGAPIPPSHLNAAAAALAERLHLLWSHCVWLTVRGQGGSQCILNESVRARPEGSDNTDAFVTLLPMGHFSAT